MSEESENKLREGLASGKYVLFTLEEAERKRKELEPYRVLEGGDPWAEGLDRFDPDADVIARHRFDDGSPSFRTARVHKDFTVCSQYTLHDGSKIIFYWYGNQCILAEEVKPS